MKICSFFHCVEKFGSRKSRTESSFSLVIDIFNLMHVVGQNVTEFDALKSLLADFKVVRFEPTEDEMDRYKDGGVAIIDQWIAAHARYEKLILTHQISLIF